MPPSNFGMARNCAAVSVPVVDEKGWSSGRTPWFAPITSISHVLPPRRVANRPMFRCGPGRCR